jgi:hypothetical protein
MRIDLGCRLCGTECDVAALENAGEADEVCSFVPDFAS